METVSSCIYGPVNSWRVGKSLGVDLLCVDSICSFACVYCQLGHINQLTAKRKIFVPTAKVLEELKNSNWREADVITFSGSGEPTLAANLGDAIREVKKLTSKPVLVLTNSSLLGSEEVCSELSEANTVFCKLDAWSDEDFSRINRPHRKINLDVLIKGIESFRREFRGKLGVQTMVLKMPDAGSLEKFAEILKKIQPDEVQLNLPLRPVPRQFESENRGNRSSFGDRDIKLKTIGFEEIAQICQILSEMTNLPVTVPPVVKNTERQKA